MFSISNLIHSFTLRQDIGDALCRAAIRHPDETVGYGHYSACYHPDDGTALLFEDGLLLLEVESVGPSQRRGAGISLPLEASRSQIAKGFVAAWTRP